MLNTIERECALKFLSYHLVEFNARCREGSCTGSRIITKITLHKTEANKFRAQPLTHKEHAVLAAFLRSNHNEFNVWLNTYELREKTFFNAVKSMEATR